LGGHGQRAVELILALRQRRTIGASAVGLAIAAMVEKAYDSEEVEACFPRARAALARATGALAAAVAVDLVPLGHVLEGVAPAKRDQFVEWCLEALRCRWGEGGLFVDAHFFTDGGIIRVDAIDHALCGGRGDALKCPPEYSPGGHASMPGAGPVSLRIMGDTVGPLPPGSWARKLDQRCLEVREELKPRRIPTRDEQESHPDSWTSTSAEYVSEPLSEEARGVEEAEGGRQEGEGEEEEMGLPVVKKEDA
jgi:hypothetical protein